MTSIVECIKKNDQVELRQYISFKFKEWAYSLEQDSDMKFSSAQEVFDFLLVDWMTQYYYGLQQEPDIQDRFLINLKKIVCDLEKYNGKVNNES